MCRTRALPAAAGPDDAGLVHLRGALLDHYDRTRRRLPWRGQTDPYRIWVSEVMLQQTRVDTVIPYYRRWMARFPDVDSLAAASEDEVLLAWEGLGYYRRARHLHAGAAWVRDRHDGRVPDSVEELRRIPGVGEYTAGAVASIAFGEPVPAVDGNVRRVLARLFDEPAPTPAWLRDRAGHFVDLGRPGDWNQALMDLGAAVCTPRSPSCGVCPVARWCAARAAGTQAERPAPAVRRPVPSGAFASAVVVDERGRALVVRRPAGGLLAGMWSFPEEPLEGGPGEGVARAAGRASAGDGAASRAVVEAALRAAADAGAEPMGDDARVLGAVGHRFTHLSATYVPVLLRGRAAEGPERRWIDIATPAGVALPAAQRRIAARAHGALHARSNGRAAPRENDART